MLKNHQTKIWESIFDQCYLKASKASDKLQNFTGWQSSYTGKAIAKHEMKSWVNETVGRIQQLSPKKIYEIGTGVGLIMLPLLEYCEYYCATDISSKSISYLKQHISSKHQHVEFAQKSADDGSIFGQDSYDMFILNSVVQYFPSLLYLEEVIKNIAEKVASGGVIFIGDVRSFKYSEAFHTSVEIYKASKSIDRALLQEKIQNRIANDVELSIDPAFFINLKKKFSRVSYIEIKLKNGIVQNELTKFRYDVLLHIEKESPKSVHEMHWISDQEVLRTEVSRLKIPFIIKHIPNYSVEGAVKAMELFKAKKEVEIKELKALIDFESASQKWKSIYALLPEGLQVEPLLEIEDPSLFSIKLFKAKEKYQTPFKPLAELPQLNLSFEAPDPKTTTPNRLESEKKIPINLSHKLTAFSISHQISISSILLGTFQILLYRYSEQSEFVLGLTQDIKTFPLLLKCNGQDSFIKTLSKIEKNLESALLERHVADLDHLIPTVFQILFSFSETDPENLNTHLTLLFSVKELDGTYSICANASPKVFLSQTIHNLLSYYCQLLESALQNPETTIDSLHLLSADTIAFLTHKLDVCPEKSYPSHILDIFQDRLKTDPDTIAIKYQNNELTYAELDRKGSQLACFLLNRGIKQRSIVAVSSFHEPRVIISILAILKLGATYLPLDPSYPKARLDGMIQDAKPEAILTQSTLLNKFDSISEIAFALDSEWENISELPSHIPQFQPSLSDTAYITYTSGSTGSPKGIMVSYKSLPHLSLARTSYYPTQTIALLAGSISFDVSILTIFHTIITGGTLCIPQPSENKDGEALIRLMHTEKVNHFMCVPSFYAMILEKSRPLAPSLQTISLVGEVIPTSVPTLHAKLAPHTKLYNEYGPSEIAIGSNIALIYDPTLKTIHRMTVGKPLPNTEVYILDSHLNLVPQGLKGEICIGGIGLAKGYLNKDVLTHKKFVNVSFPGQPPMKLYRTGDFGRLLEDGNLDFLGRIDYQVKIRGHRIELGEVELILSLNKEIDEAVVILQKDTRNQDCLAAYFTTIDRNILSLKELKDYIKALLPQYMVPTFFMQLKAFPRDPNNKIDRKALPKVSERKNTAQTTFPTSEFETKLLEIWKEVLNLNRIDLNATFFDIGGNSLLLANVQTSVKEILNIDVPIVDFFRYPTVLKFAKHLQILSKQKVGSV